MIGASKNPAKPKWTAAYTEQLVKAGVRHVVILPDNDATGRAHGLAVATGCHAAGLQVQLVNLPGVPAKGDVSDWLAAGAQPLVGALRAANADDEMWAWGADQHVRFWSRRQLHETAIHRADARLALGREPTMTTAVAIDSVDELLDNLPYSAPNVANLKGNGETVHLHATDAPKAGEWLITLTPDGFTYDHAHSKATVALQGSAVDLALLCWGRISADDSTRYATFGDRTLLDHWLANSAL